MPTNSYFHFIRSLSADSTKDCQKNSCVENAICIQTPKLRSCECDCGYIGSGYESCIYVEPSKLTIVTVGFKMPITIPNTTNKHDIDYQTSRTVVEHVMDPILSEIGMSYYGKSIIMIDVMYVT